ncbi:Polyprenol reductase 2 [Micractinium conductrix]|uniref:Polyprenol reductase 2 n=1 Tax=Micractinium conductrix TaxID=554055 RepID=A0A2P6VAX3_9CHLO|nr:Polyprenol reductase 2 [Micractinium conductrix]|eukprot:PSC71218.1 Polyprenol reductase 2 [Micractinium conductrix]
MDDAPRRALGPLSDWTVPQAWFAHFYALGAAWNAVVAWALLRSGYLASLPAPTAASAALALALLQLHLTRRLVETVGLLHYPPGSRMHGIAYLFGMSYYFLVSLSVLPDSAYPALAQLLGDPGALLSGGRPAPPAARWVLAHVTSLQLAGAALFLAGNALQCHSHWLLARLARRGRKGGYKIPRGGAFELVSCPHYLGEVVIYAGLALVAGGGRRVTAWLMLLWVLTNLSLAAGMTHQWYQQHFKTYPRRRAALLPWIY